MAKELMTLGTAQTLLEKMKPQLRMALPKHMNSERLARIALTELRNIPKLQQCSQQSFMKCLMVSAQLGLEPGLLGHVYFIPFKDEAQIIIGYKGMIELAGRSGKIESIEAWVVHANDKCHVKLGTDSFIDHEVDVFSKDRGAAIGYYAVAKIKGGGKQFQFMTTAEIDKVKAQSKSANNGPWVTHYDEMAKKTVIRRLFKYLPVSVEIQQANLLEEATEIKDGYQKDVIDAEFFTVDTETGEVLEDEAPTNQANALANKIK